MNLLTRIMVARITNCQRTIGPGFNGKNAKGSYMPLQFAQLAVI